MTRGFVAKVNIMNHTTLLMCVILHECFSRKTIAAKLFNIHSNIARVTSYVSVHICCEMK